MNYRSTLSCTEYYLPKRLSFMHHEEKKNCPATEGMDSSYRQYYHNGSVKPHTVAKPTPFTHPT